MVEGVGESSTVSEEVELAVHVWVRDLEVMM